MTQRYNFRVIITQYIAQILSNAFAERAETPAGLTFVERRQE
jgi:hypothetical protein